MLDDDSFWKLSSEMVKEEKTVVKVEEEDSTEQCYEEPMEAVVVVNEEVSTSLYLTFFLVLLFLCSYALLLISLCM